MRIEVLTLESSQVLYRERNDVKGIYILIDEPIEFLKNVSNNLQHLACYYGLFMMWWFSNSSDKVRISKIHLSVLNIIRRSLEERIFSLCYRRHYTLSFKMPRNLAFHFSKEVAFLGLLSKLAPFANNLLSHLLKNYKFANFFCLAEPIDRRSIFWIQSTIGLQSLLRHHLWKSRWLTHSKHLTLSTLFDWFSFVFCSRRDRLSEVHRCSLRSSVTLF